MKNIFVLLAATSAISLATSAYASEETTKTSATSADGTTHTSDSTVKVDVDSKGRIDKTVTTDSSTDAKGVMNKKQDSSETQIEEKARGGYTQTTTNKHTDANGTDLTMKTMTNVDVDTDGKITTTATTEKTTDPKGLMNKEVSTTKSKSVNGKVIELNKKVK